MRAPKKVPQTDAIFDRLKEVNPEADRSAGMLRLSLDAKTSVKVGRYSHKGKSRVLQKAEDHDHGAKEVLTPYGILLPRYDELALYFTTSKVTSDFMVDVLDGWWQANRSRFPLVGTLVINQDNGPENKSRRTPFLERMVGFAREYQLLVRLAYYPPYHSKYNLIEHCWGVLERHWNGDLLNSREAVVRFAESMTWNGKHPKVSVLTGACPKGVRLPKRDAVGREGSAAATVSRRLVRGHPRNESAALDNYFLPSPLFPCVPLPFAPLFG